MIVLPLLASQPCIGQQLDTSMWITNGPVHAIAEMGDTLFLGGQFNYAGPYTGSGVPLSGTTGLRQAKFPVINGPVYAVESDENGGWYVGGRFTKAGHLDVENLVHVLPSGEADTIWRPGGVYGAVYALEYYQDRIYAGGDFDYEGRKNIAAFYSQTGKEWDPDSLMPTVDGPVYVIHVDYTPSFYYRDSMVHRYTAPGTYYVCFTATCPADSDDPACTDTWCDSVTIGNFADCVAAFRNRVNPAKINGIRFENNSAGSWDKLRWDFGDNKADTLNPNPEHIYPAKGAYYTCLSVWNSSDSSCADTWCDSVFVGTTGYCMANFNYAIDSTDNLNVIFNLNDLSYYKKLLILDFGDGTVDTFPVIGESGSEFLYVGGDFTMVNNEYRGYLAKMSLFGSLPIPKFQYDVNGPVKAIASTNKYLYIGGDFGLINNNSIPNLAKLDKLTVRTVDWLPSPGGTVRSIIVQDTILYVAGDIKGLFGQPRQSIASYNLPYNYVLPWLPQVKGRVNSLAVQDSVIYVGGAFTGIGATPISRLACINRYTGDVQSWEPGPSDTVNALAAYNNVTYAGGNYIIMNGVQRNNFAAIDRNSGKALPLVINTNNLVSALHRKGNTLYAGGYFTSIGTKNIRHLAAIDLLSGSVTDWNIGADGPVRAIATAGNVLYAGGLFSYAGQENRSNLAAIDIATARATPWKASTNGTVNTLALEGNRLYAGGYFTEIGGQPRSYLAALDTAVLWNVTPWRPDANDGVYSILKRDNMIYAGGLFTSIGGQLRSHLAAIDTDTGVASFWQPDPSGPVLSIAPHGSSLFAAGSFNVTGNAPRSNAAQHGLTSAQPTSWTGNADKAVNVIYAASADAYLGGSFLHINGVPHPYFARLIGGIVTAAADPTAVTREFRLYPNPTGSIVMIAGAEGASPKTITILNPVGQVVGRHIDHRTDWFDISMLKSGLYFIHIETWKGIHVDKLVKQ